MGQFLGARAWRNGAPAQRHLRVTPRNISDGSVRTSPCFSANGLTFRKDAQPKRSSQPGTKRDRRPNLKMPEKKARNGRRRCEDFIAQGRSHLGLPRSARENPNPDSSGRNKSRQAAADLAQGFHHAVLHGERMASALGKTPDRPCASASRKKACKLEAVRG